MLGRQLRKVLFRERLEGHLVLLIALEQEVQEVDSLLVSVPEPVGVVPAGGAVQDKPLALKHLHQTRKLVDYLVEGRLQSVDILLGRP